MDKKDKILILTFYTVVSPFNVLVEYVIPCYSVNILPQMNNIFWWNFINFIIFDEEKMLWLIMIYKTNCSKAIPPWIMLCETFQINRRMRNLNPWWTECFENPNIIPWWNLILALDLSSQKLHISWFTEMSMDSPFLLVLRGSKLMCAQSDREWGLTTS